MFGGLNIEALKNSLQGTNPSSINNRKTFFPLRSKIFFFTLCDVFLFQERLIEVDVFQQAVFRQSLPHGLWFDLKQSEKKHEIY